MCVDSKKLKMLRSGYCLEIRDIMNWIESVVVAEKHRYCLRHWQEP